MRPLPALDIVDPHHRARVSDAQARIRSVALSIPDAEFGVIFGSFATGRADSDVDFKIVTRGEPTGHVRSLTAALAHDLNGRYGPCRREQADDDVPFERKTVIARRIVRQSIALEAFGGRAAPQIRPIALSAEFLASDECQMRTALSALTSPNVRAFGSADAFDDLRRRAFRALHRLLTGGGRDGADIDTLVDRAIHSGDGRSGKAHLGYADTAMRRDWLRGGLSAVAPRA